MSQPLSAVGRCPPDNEDQKFGIVGPGSRFMDGTHLQTKNKDKNSIRHCEITGIWHKNRRINK